MKLTIFTPIGIVLQSKISKITAETMNGYYTLLPRHVDMAASIDTNIITYITEDKQERYVACHRGIIVKKGENVTITVQNAVVGENLDDLIKVIKFDFKQNEELRKELNTAMARLEMGVIRGLEKLHKGGAYG